MATYGTSPRSYDDQRGMRRPGTRDTHTVTSRDSSGASRTTQHAGVGRAGTDPFGHRNAYRQHLKETGARPATAVVTGRGEKGHLHDAVRAGGTIASTEGGEWVTINGAHVFFASFA